MPAYQMNWPRKNGHLVRLPRQGIASPPKVYPPLAGGQVESDQGLVTQGGVQPLPMVKDFDVLEHLPA
jgi:hypothetical protein